ncbi:galactose mutarotase [Carbonactinospora thermoautotrophica]|uniref:Galactose mutarotase n=2 Tax=Carbonactinospora thermoautotrophica TaxID=1469144 RepID=A0A132MJ78_9ACTN|nr:aldose 1-epimerase family protein [Carbonactinospora thermoautotrophica]KWW97809.1 galactose mutarotase [Carbonactinospora thermoautotrophica]
MGKDYTGTQYELAGDGYTAVVTEAGAALRQLRHEGRDLVAGFEATEMMPLYRGAILAPWPNRIADGRYTFHGRTHQLPVNEVDRATAIHGLVAFAPFGLVDRGGDHVVLAYRLFASPGYPFTLLITVEHRLGPGGLTTKVTATNGVDEPAPYGIAPHPYLTAGPGRVDDWELELPAERYLEVTPDRLLPTGSVLPVEGTGYDFRAPRRVGGVRIDLAYTGLRPGEDGLARARVRAAEGRGVELRWDPAVLPWVQVHTADRPEPRFDRAGLAVEPMTCPPDAFNSGTDLVVLEPGAAHAASWTIGAC